MIRDERRCAKLIHNNVESILNVSCSVYHVGKSNDLITTSIATILLNKRREDVKLMFVYDVRDVVKKRNSFFVP